MDAQLKKGLLEICVLASICEKESYDYKIISDVKPYIEISESTLYPILRRLEKNGAVISRDTEFNGRRRKYFSITPLGRAKIYEFIEDTKEFRRVSDFIATQSLKG